MAQKTFHAKEQKISKRITSEPVKWFKCISCNSSFYPIDKKSFYSFDSSLSQHKDCEIKYFTEKQYSKAFSKKVTHKRHKHLSEQQFLKKARILCRIEGDFSRLDFGEISRDVFRQKISRLRRKGIIFNLIGGTTPTYTVKGEKRWVGKGNVTLEGMGVGKDFEKILRDVSISYPKIHKIKIIFPSSGLYNFLKKDKRKVDKNNKRIKMMHYSLNEHVGANVSVYPDTVEVDLSCTNTPIVYDTNGALVLISILQKLRDTLIFQTNYGAENVPDCLGWIVKQYHFNKDSQKTYGGEKFEVTVSEMSAGFIRFYSKKFQDGSIRVRLEQSRNPNNSVADESVKMIKTDNYVHDRVGSKISDAQANEFLYIHHRKRPQGGRQTSLQNYIDFNNKTKKRPKK